MRLVRSPWVWGIALSAALGLVLALAVAVGTGVPGLGDGRVGDAPSLEALAGHEASRPLLASAVDTRIATIAQPTPLDHARIVDPGPEHFDAGLAMAVVRELTDLGPRTAGSPAEAAGFDLLEQRLRDLGFAVERQTVFIPGGVSRNIVAERPGTSEHVILLGAHVDTKDPSPGGNDNASGCGVVMALAAAFADVHTEATLRFVFFGSEEIVGSNRDDHHFGSQHYVDSMSEAEKDVLAGMISVDMVGYGPDFHVRTMQKGPQSVSAALQAHASEFDYPLTYLSDPGWSDHEPFESAQIPAAWIQWRDDPDYHTVRDTYGHVSIARVRTTGELIAGYLLSLSAEDLAALGS